MANYLGSGALAAAYLAILFYAAAGILEGLSFFALQIRPLSALGAVQKDRARIRAWLARIISVGAFVAWVLLALGAFSAREAIFARGKALLDAEIAIRSLHLSLGAVLAFALTIWIALLLSRFIRFLLEEDIYRRLHLARGASYAVSTILHYIILLAGFFAALAAVGVDMTKFAILAGAFGVGIGFGLQNIFNNFFSGLILLFERPVQVGDVVEVGTATGVVRRIGIRASIIRLADSSELIVPNGQLISEKVTNRTFSSRQQTMQLRLRAAYGSDPERVLEILTRIAAGHPQVMKQPAPEAFLKEFGTDGLLFDLVFTTDTPLRAPRVQSDVAVAVNTALRAAGIEIPFPQRVVHLQNTADDGADRADDGAANDNQPGGVPASAPVMNPPSRRAPGWPRLFGAAAVGGFATLFVARNFFPNEKKIRHRIHADYSACDDTFVRTVGQMLGPPLLPNNKVTALQNGEEIFPAMLEGIRSARTSITFENFLWREGEVSDAFAAALVERAHAGVKVHFLQDALGCDALHGRAMNLLRGSPVELEIFRFLNLELNFRTHRKLLVIDGRLGFIGGTGIADDWQGNGRIHGFWRDSHYRIEGPVVGQLQQAFMDNWVQTRATLLHGDDYFPQLTAAGDDLCQVFKSSAGEGSDSARLMLLISIAAARHHIRIANAYFIPDELCRQTLIEACERGVKVEVIVPGSDIDAQLVRVVGKARWGPLLAAGVRFYEYQPARFHCKYLLVDDCWASVGSANLDNRSLSLNEEANLNVLDREFVAMHTRVFEDDKRHSREVTMDEWRRRPWTQKLRGRLGMIFRSQM